MREALNTLHAKALIESSPQKGVRVCPRNDCNVLDPEVIGWLYEVGPDRSFLDSLGEVQQ